jgi:hypothetical protein
MPLYSKLIKKNAAESSFCLQRIKGYFVFPVSMLALISFSNVM